MSFLPIGPLVMLLLVAASSASAFSAGIVSYVPGVVEGNWAKYTINTSYSGNETLLRDTFGGPPYPILCCPWPSTIDFVNVTSLSVNVTKVSGASANITIGDHFSNGTIRTHIDVENVTNENFFGFMVIARGLNSSDSIEPHLNGTEYRTVLGATRAVNFVNIRFSERNLSNGDVVYQHSVNSWDRSTGMLVSSSLNLTLTRHMNSYSSNGTILSLIDVSSSDLWSGPGTVFGVQPYIFYAFIIVAAVLFVLGIVGVVLRRRERERLKSTPDQHAASPLG